MRLSRYFLPVLKETPADATIQSHIFMLRAGMMKQMTAGIYSWLPLGLKVLQNISTIVREEMNRAGCVEVLMPTMQPSELWQESGRYDSYGKEMLRLKDRHDREMVFGPTNEEMITDIFRSYIKSYKDLPQNLYQIQWKFRDEIRPRFGVMRGREFLMKDSYSFDLTPEEAVASYENYYEAYLRTFQRLGVIAIPVRADTGPIGGTLSHEFQILADTGESTVYYDQRFDDLRSGKLSMTTEQMRTLYAAADEQHDPSNCPIPAEELRQARGIEVGHIFNFGTKYSAAMNATVADKEGHQVAVQMGSYGIGVSRLVGAIIEAHHDENGIIWPESVAPFKLALLNICVGDADCDRTSQQAYEQLQRAGVEVLYDDTEDRPGVKFARADLIGCPWILTIGPRGLKQGVVELKNRRTGDKQEVSLEAALNRFLG